MKAGWRPGSVPVRASSSSTSRPSSCCQRSGRDSKLIITVHRLRPHGLVHLATVIDDGGVDVDKRQMDAALVHSVQLAASRRFTAGAHGGQRYRHRTCAAALHRACGQRRWQLVLPPRPIAWQWSRC
jgi:hypothetical protein